MRLVIIALLSFPAFVDTSRADDPYIHAPSPPYCSPRGGDPNCLSTEPWRSRGKYQERWLSPAELHAVEISDIADFVPNVWIAHPLEEHRSWFVFLGSATLKLLGPENGEPRLARIELQSKRVLSERRARRLERGFRAFLAHPSLERIEVERFADESRVESESDWCEFEREGAGDAWKLYCDVE